MVVQERSAKDLILDYIERQSPEKLGLPHSTPPHLSLQAFYLSQLQQGLRTIWSSHM